MPVRFKRVQIRHLMGVEEAEYEPGTLTIFEGENGTGKTSHVRALWSLLGRDAKQPAVMNGFTEGDISVELDNGYTLEKVFSGDKPARLVVRDQRGKAIAAPQDFVDRMLRAISMNPLRFADDGTPKKERLEMLLSVAPIQLSQGEITDITGNAYDLTKWFKGNQAVQNGLPVIDAIHKQIYERDRRDVNRDLSQKEAHVAELRATLPAETPADHSERLQGCKNELLRIQAERQRMMKQAHDDRDVRLSRLRAEEQARIAEIQREYEATREAVRKDAEQALAASEADLVSQQTAKAAELATLEEQSKAYHQAEQTRTNIERYEREAAALKARSEAFTAMLAKLDDLRRSKLDDLPIPVQINGEDILVEVPERGLVPIEDVNTAKRMGLALQLAVEAAGDCGAICIDGIERLDRKRLEAFQAAALEFGEQRGLQFFATRVVPDGELQIRTVSPGDPEPTSLFVEQPAASDPTDHRRRGARRK